MRHELSRCVNALWIIGSTLQCTADTYAMGVNPNYRSCHGLSSRERAGPDPNLPKGVVMTKIAKSEAPAPNAVATNSPTLATLLAVLERDATQSETRLRDLRSAVKRVAVLLGNEPGALALDLSAISAQLATVSPVAVGMTVKRLTNIRSDFLAAVKTSGVIPIKFEVKNTLSPAWGELFSRLSGRRAHIGLSRLARYASSHRIEPGEINDTVIDKFIAAVREGSLHQS